MAAADRQLPITGFAHKAGVVGAADHAAVAALFEVPTKQGRATGLDRRHDASLDPAEMSAMAATERFAVVADIFRHLQRRTHRCGSGRRRHLKAQPVDRARRATDGAGRNLRVAGRGVHVVMAERSRAIMRIFYALKL